MKRSNEEEDSQRKQTRLVEEGEGERESSSSLGQSSTDLPQQEESEEEEYDPATDEMMKNMRNSLRDQQGNLRITDGTQKLSGGVYAGSRQRALMILQRYERKPRLYTDPNYLRVWKPGDKPKDFRWHLRPEKRVQLPAVGQRPRLLARDQLASVRNRAVRTRPGQRNLMRRMKRLRGLKRGRDRQLVERSGHYLRNDRRDPDLIRRKEESRKKSKAWHWMKPRRVYQKSDYQTNEQNLERVRRHLQARRAMIGANFRRITPFASRPEVPPIPVHPYTGYHSPRVRQLPTGVENIEDIDRASESRKRNQEMLRRMRAVRRRGRDRQLVERSKVWANRPIDFGAAPYVQSDPQYFPTPFVGYPSDGRTSGRTSRASTPSYTPPATPPSPLLLPTYPAQSPTESPPSGSSPDPPEYGYFGDPDEDI